MKEQKGNSSILIIGFITVTLLVFGFSVMALAKLDSPKRVTKKEIYKHYNPKDFGSFPIAVNDRVIKQINWFLQTRERRHFVKASLENLKVYSNDRNREGFSKEVHYKSRHMRQRRVFREESIDKYDALLESLAPTYLQRKLEQGKKKL